MSQRDPLDSLLNHHQRESALRLFAELRRREELIAAGAPPDDRDFPIVAVRSVEALKRLPGISQDRWLVGVVHRAPTGDLVGAWRMITVDDLVQAYPGWEVHVAAHVMPIRAHLTELEIDDRLAWSRHLHEADRLGFMKGTPP